MIDTHAAKRLAVAAALFLLAGLSCAADPARPSPATPKEQREKMAQAHEKMAGCLRSDRAIVDCRQEMMQTCQDMKGAEGCGMMMGRGMMGPKAAQDPKPDASTGDSAHKH